jgi:hypothetical protein
MLYIYNNNNNYKKQQQQEQQKLDFKKLNLKVFCNISPDKFIFNF